MNSTKQNVCTWFEHNRAPFFLALLTVGMFAVVELKHPFFFLDDDNLQQNLPYYVHNIRSVLAGEFPLFNFHQYLGMPVFSTIQSAALYPPIYAALILSKLVLGHYSGAMEFIALFHLLLAALGFYRLMHYFGLGGWSCCFGAIAWTFCGYVMVGGHAWIPLVEFAAYLPWILLFSLRQMGKFDLRCFAVLVVLRVSALYLGNPPYFIYTATFDLLTVSILYFVASGKGAVTRDDATFPPVRCGFAAFLVKQGICYLCVILIAAPLLLPAMHQIGISANRKAPMLWEQYSLASYSLANWLNGLFTPFSGMRATYWAPFPLQFISHIGWLTLFFCGAAFWQRRVNRRLVAVFLILALFSFLWANDTWVTRLFFYLPLYNRQRWPCKLAFFTSFFLIVVATFGVDVLYKRIKGPPGRVTAILAMLFLMHIGNFLALYLAAPQGVFAPPDKSSLYEERLGSVLKSGRIVTVVQKSTLDDGNFKKRVPLLGSNYATLFGLYHFAGYDPLVPEKNVQAALGLNGSADFYLDGGIPFDPSTADLDYFRKWGVKWYVLDRNVRLEGAGILKPVYRDDNRVVLYDAAARPFVFWRDNAGGGESSYLFTTNRIKVETERESAGQLLVNVLYNPFFAATVDGKKANITETEEMQMLVDVPPGRHSILITYSDPYFVAGLYVSAVFTVIACLLYRCRGALARRMM